MEEFESPPLWVLVITYYNYIVMTLFGYIRDILRNYNIEKNRMAKELQKVQDFPALYDSFAGFYTVGDPKGPKNIESLKNLISCVNCETAPKSCKP